MSLDATRWAWTQQNLRPMHKLILLSLADRAGADNVAYPSYAQLQADTGADRKTIWKAFKHLQAFGLIEDTLARKGTTKNVIVWRLIGVADRTAQAKNQNKKTASTIPKTEQFRKRNSSENGTLNSSENGTLNSSENGIRNLSVEPTNETTTIVDTRARAREDETATAQRATRHGHLSAFLRQQGVTITPAHPKLCEWVAADLSNAEAQEAINRARLYKPAPETIPANYLAAIVIRVIQERTKNPAAASTAPGTLSYSNRNQGGHYAKPQTTRANIADTIIRMAGTGDGPAPAITADEYARIAAGRERVCHDDRGLSEPLDCGYAS